MFEIIKNFFTHILLTNNIISINKIKDNLPIIFIIPTTIGGIWQLFELSSFGISYIRFFSVPQLLPDGLLIITMLAVIYYYLHMLTQVYESSKFEYYLNKTLSNLIFLLVLNIVIAIGITTFLTIRLPVNTAFTTFAINLAILYFLFKCILLIIKLFITINFKVKNIQVDKLDEFIINFKAQDYNKPYVTGVTLLYFITIILSSVVILKPLRNFAYYPSNLENLTKLENELIKNFRLCEPPKLEYFNKDYLFYEVQIEDKKRIYIIESKNLFLSPLEPIIKEKKESED
ncbi:hypothetical protein ACT433_13785 [Acinetobacter baumannii]|nr:hypothetical protein [Acinetobacter baumannii]MDC4947894.1 hypothetical protein [Acinetobacter baumannii]